MNKRQKLFALLLGLVMLVLTGLLIYFSLKLAQNNKTLNELFRKVDELQLTDVQDGKDGRTPSNEEILSLIRPLIPNPIPGRDGIARDGANGTDGASGTNGADAQPCTTYTDENNDSYIACPDGTQTLIPKPDQPAQIELCSTATIPLGWRYVGTTICQKVKVV